MQQSTKSGCPQPSNEGGTTPAQGSQLTILRTALQHALDELNRVNASYNCVRPDVTYAAADALRKTFLGPIKNASEIEQRIVGKVITDLLDADYFISVNDGEDDVVTDSKDAAEIFAALASTDTDTIHVTHPRKKRSFVFLVWGNDVDVISDYGVSLEDVLAGANALAEELAR